MAEIPDKSYWEQRALQREKRAFNDAGQYLKELEKQYAKAMRNIEKDISLFYAKYADQNNVPYAKAVEYLNAKERKEFQVTLEEFIKMAETNIGGQFTQQLRNISARVRISRLQAILTEIQSEVERLFYEEGVGYQPQTYNLLERTMTETYHRSIYDIQTGTQVGFSFQGLNQNAIKEALDYPWSGANFSERIWNNKNKLVIQLRNTFTQSIIQGSSVDKMTQEIRNKMNVSYRDAVRLVRTESNHVFNTATLRSYADAEIEKYEYLATLDSRTSDICQGLDGKKYKIEDARPGINFPPMHVFCRSTTIAVIDDEDTEEKQRIAKGDDGKYYHIPANMTYPEWYKKYVERI